MTLDSIRNSCDVFAICVTTVIALNGVLKHRPPLLQLGGPLDFLYFLFSWMFLLKYLTFISFLSQYQMWRGWVEREAKQGGGVSRLLPPDPPGRFLTTRLDNFFWQFHSIHPAEVQQISVFGDVELSYFGFGDQSKTKSEKCYTNNYHVGFDSMMNVNSIW